MSVLSGISKPQDRPVIVTLCGDSGMGKTTLAATFPNPIVIRAEDGLQAIPADKLNRVAKEAGVDKFTLYRMMKENAKPSYETVKKLSDWLGGSV